jgi:hypothetical protein
MLPLDEIVRHFGDEFTVLLAGAPSARTGARARLLVRGLVEALHATLGGENLRVFVHVLASDAMGAARLSPAARAEVHAWLRVRLAREGALLDLLATADTGDGRAAPHAPGA